MNVSYEESRENLQALIAFWEASNRTRNEDTTRFHLIDTMWLDCLGWDKADITTEEAHGREYADYVFRLIRPVFIVEAKREGNYFELAVGHRGIEYSLASLCKDNVEFKAAIEQVHEYCQKRGIEIAIVSNGWQYVAFVANRLDGVPPLEGRAIVFESLESIRDNFLDFWNLFSKPAFEKRLLRRNLLGEVLPELPAKLSTIIQSYPGIKNRNSFQTNMQVVSDLILEDVIRYEELEEIFLEECYCNAGALSNYSEASKDILRTRYEYLFEKNESPVAIEPISTKKGISKDFKEVAAQSLSKRPILLIGDVGVGKTSFIKNLIKVEAKEVFEKCITFRIDLGSKIIIALNIQTAVVDEIIDQLLSLYGVDIFENSFVKGVYNLEFERFKKGIYAPYFESGSEKSIEKSIEFFEEKIKNRSDHLRHSLAHIAKARKQQVVIFIDNCDQRDYNTQQTAFLVAQELAEHWSPVTVFVSLRPETFHSSLKKGTLSGYHPKAFTIAPPRVDLVIHRRLVFAKKISAGQIPVARLGSIVGLTSLTDLLSIMIYSFERNDRLYSFIDNVSNGNIRIALDMVRNFLGSGYVNTEKMLNVFHEQGSYDISLHEFLKAVILGDNAHFDPETSVICNVFDLYNSDPKEHFLSLIVLGILEAKMHSGKDNGFIEALSVSNSLQGIGFGIDQIDAHLSLLIRKGLIETSAKGTTFEQVSPTLSIRLTSVGSYHLNNLVETFEFIDAVVVDTPIFTGAVREQIQEVYQITDRLKRGATFVEYLDNVWNENFKDVKGLFINWPDISRKLKSVMDNISKRFSY